MSLKRILFSISVILLVVSAGLVRAQSGALCVYSDTQGFDCDINDDVPSLLTVYVVHTETFGATAVEFSAPMPACMTGATFLSDTSPHAIFIGGSQVGASVAYGACLLPTVHVLTISYFGQGQTQADCAYPVIAHQQSGNLQMVDCNFLTHPVTGGTSYINSSLPCDCAAAPLPPVLDVSPTSLQFGLSLTDLDVDIRNVGGGTLDWSAASNESWISVDPETGTGDATMAVTVDRTGLPGEVYQGTVAVTSNGGSINVGVMMSVPGVGPILDVSPLSLSFPPGTTINFFNVTNAGDGDLIWSINETIPWLSTNVSGGVNNQTLTVTVNRAGLSQGTYTGDIMVTSNAGNETIAVDMEVPPPMPALGFSPTSLSFAATVSQLYLDIFNQGTGTLSWNITPSEPWVSVEPASGDGDLPVSVMVDRTGLPDGTHSADLNITSNGGNGTVPLMVSVTSTPVLVVDPTLLVFNQFTGTLSFMISNAGVGMLEWSVSSADPWINILPPLSGIGDAFVPVAIDVNALPGGGQQTGSVDVTSNGGNASVTVRFNPLTGYQGYLVLSADPQGYQCAITEPVGGLMTAYVVHANTSGSTASSFSAPAPSCLTGSVYLADQSQFSVVIGNSQTGVSVGYGGCLGGNIVVLSMLFFAQGGTAPCCVYDILPHPSGNTGQIESVDCGSNLRTIFASVGVINEEPQCYCGLVKVEETSWGRLKSLYAPEE